MAFDPLQLWLDVCAPHFPGERAAENASALCAAENALWDTAMESQSSSKMSALFERAGVRATEELLASYLELWEPHTITHPEAGELLEHLHRRGIRVGVLSNTLWPRSWHERVFQRDGVLDLIDGAVYTSEIAWTKPHPRAFRAAMAAIGMDDPTSCVFVGDRPYDDIHGAKNVGMRAVLIPNDGVPSFDGAIPDAVIASLSELRPLIDAW